MGWREGGGARGGRGRMNYKIKHIELDSGDSEPVYSNKTNAP